MPHSASRPTNRYAWVDFAKGFCIIAVVALWVTHEYEARGWGEQVSWLNRFVWWAKPFRMPDFFLISGLFLSRVIDRPWRHYLDTKVVHYLYFFVLWTTLLLPLMWLFGRGTPETLPQALQQWADHLVGTPFAMLWFIMFLSIYFIVTRLTHRVPVWVMLPVAAALMIFPASTGEYHVDRFGMYFVFFYAGHVFADRFFALADWARNRPRISVALLLIWAAANKLAIQWGWGELHAPSLVLGFIGISAVVMLSALVSELRWARWLTYLGRNSIAVYLGFYVPMVLIVEVLHHHTPLHGNLGAIGAAALVGSVSVAMLMFEAARRLGLNFLYQRPDWARIVSSPRNGSAHRAARLPQETAATP